jgi:hypothetical protein
MEVTPQDKSLVQAIVCPLGIDDYNLCSDWSEDKMFHFMEREVTMFLKVCM